VVHHGAGLRVLLKKEGGAGGANGFVEALAGDHTAVDLEPADRAMLDYALKLTRRPGEMESEDVGALRTAGFDDRSIHDICSIACYFAFVNRLADGLGVELEPSHDSDPLRS